ncbi:hypothetical protein RND71_007723 [Anisodus tanguticus]|uniref:Chaperone DnaJ C-terminal domain-containing protein n=1 Tax=Anisodus tanguticus TaxID=243964 RepID=A0AAE1VTA5_9SOLA|nr:hypothetical protein RND71_007723 [Anisodus tanguticus]
MDVEHDSSIVALVVAGLVSKREKLPEIQLLVLRLFIQLAQAYEVLSDLEKREIYDQYDEDALKEGTGGGDGGSSRGTRQRRGEDVIHPLKPETITGDIVFVLQQKEHPKFKLMGDDLFVEHTLTLAEAICGFQFILTHLNNRKLLIKSQPVEIAKPDQFKAINDEGMPMYQRPFMRGELYIHLTIDFRVIVICYLIIGVDY